MSAAAMRSFKGLFTVALACCVSAVMVGCAGESGDKVADNSNKAGSTKASKPADSTSMAKITRAQPAPKKAVAKQPAPRQPVAQKKAPVQATAVKKAPAPVVKKAQQADPQPRNGGQDQLRRDTTDAIYAAIRVRMEQAILNRKELLDGGRDASDVEIQDLESQIIKARGYLIEAGEEVEDVNPPLSTK